ncbi:MAG: YdcF family protein [Bacteroidota bacterium]
MRKFFAITAVLAFLLLFIFVKNSSLQKFDNSQLSTNSFDAIVVLGGGVYGQCRLSTTMQIRMNMATEFLQRKIAPVLIVSGGLTNKGADCTEAEAMRQYALSNGVASRRIMMEQKALNTYQNAFWVDQIQGANQLEKVLVITSDFHAARANLIFELYNRDYQVFSVMSDFEGLDNLKILAIEQSLLSFHSVFGLPSEFGLHLKEKKVMAVLRSLAGR